MKFRKTSKHANTKYIFTSKQEYPTPGSKKASDTLKSYIGTVFQKVIDTLSSKTDDERKLLVLNHGISN